MKGYVYILECCNGRYYVGSTSDLSDRLERHFQGRSKATKNLRPLRLVFSQNYASFQDARRIESWLKKQKDKRLLRRIVNEGLIVKQLS